MKKIEKENLKKIKGGEDDTACLTGCVAAYNVCLNYSTLAYCKSYRQRCFWHCQGCNPICP
jgi:hypothetical protein